MTVEACCQRWACVSSISIPPMAGQPATTLTVDSPMDGSEVPALVGGKPSGETMAITRVDDRHYNAVVKMNGQPLSTHASTVSPDGKTLTVNSVTQGGGQVMKFIETWVRQ